MESQLSPAHPRFPTSSEEAGAAYSGGVHIRSANSSTTPASCRKASTEHQLRTSRSNYEILASSAPLPSTSSLTPSLRSSIGKKRAQHQREEKIRRDRLKHALELLAAILPPNLSSSPASPKGQARNSNRAETVEQAIEYINSLHSRLDDGVKRRDSCGCEAG